jgi:hypothetical protein
MMSDFWKCPHCRNTQEKTDQLKLMEAARRADAVVFANISSRAFPCRFCGRTVDIADVAEGRLDAESPFGEADDFTTFEEPAGPVGAFLGGFVAGGAVGFFGVNIVVGTLNWLFGLGITPVYRAGLVGAIVGAFGCGVLCLISALRARK